MSERPNELRYTTIMLHGDPEVGETTQVKETGGVAIRLEFDNATVTVFLSGKEALDKIVTAWGFDLLDMTQGDEATAQEAAMFCAPEGGTVQS